MNLYRKSAKQSTRLAGIVIFTLLLNILVSAAVFYFLRRDFSYIVSDNEIVQKDIVVERGAVSIGKKAQIMGNIHLAKGHLLILADADIKGDVVVDDGNVTIKEGVHIKGDLTLEKGDALLENDVVIEGNLFMKNGELQKHSTSVILKTKPDIFITYDYPDSLAYFDILPEAHKEALGYVFLTKKSNTIIREQDVKNPEDYFDGIYYFQDHHLLSVDVMSHESLKFFKRAREFFNDLPERRLGPYSVGATTKNYAHDSHKADIYIPSEGARYTFLHEMGHVVDFQQNYSDYHDPVYPFISKEAALNNYGATHPGEDFAEAYKYYLIAFDRFSQLIEEKPERQQKYDFLKRYVFANKEYRVSS